MSFSTLGEPIDFSGYERENIPFDWDDWCDNVVTHYEIVLYQPEALVTIVKKEPNGK